MTDQPTPADDDFVARLRLAHQLQVFSGGGPPTPPAPSLGELLDELGVKLLPPDDPVYTSGAYVFFSDEPAPTRDDRPSRLDAIQPAPRNQRRLRPRRRLVHADHRRHVGEQRQGVAIGAITAP